MEDKFKIDICLYGNAISPKEITRLIGVEPNTALLRGERNKERDLPRQNIWSVYSDSNLRTVEEQWSSVFKLFGKKWEKFVEISKNGDVKITIVIDVYENVPLPEIRIPPAMSFAAAQLSAEIDVAYY